MNEYESACEYCESVYGKCKLELGYPDEECEDNIYEENKRIDNQIAQDRYESDMIEKDVRAEQLINGEGEWYERLKNSEGANGYTKDGEMI